MSFPRYDDYRESGIKYLGPVPSHWEIKHLKRVVHVEMGQSPPSEACNDLGNGQPFLQGCAEFGVRCPEAKLFCEDPPKVARQGDVLLSVRAPVGDLNVADQDYGIGRGLCAVRQTQLAPEFLPWLLETSVDQLLSVATGSTYHAVSAEDVRTVYVAVPSLLEQTSIAAFLDRETGKIDALVEEQRRLIALLKGKRQAIISHAVTKGLDPSVLMKDSGIDWLGEIPARWDRVQLGRLCRQVSDGPHFSPRYVDDGVLFLSARNVKVDAWSLDDAKFISEEDCAEFDRRIVPERGDVLYTKGGTTGVARVVDFDNRFQVWVHIAVLELHRDLCDPEFIAYSLNSSGCYEQAQLFTRGATNQDLGLTRMVKIWLSLPPIDQQKAIVESLNRETAEIDCLIREVEKALSLLGERRAALIFAAVTGKIDVRGFVRNQAEAA